MKKSAWLSLALVIAGLIALQGSGIYHPDATASHGPDFVYPSTVKKVIDQKCYGCHSIKGRSDKAKEALMWDSVPNLQKAKIVGTLNDIIDVLDDGSMPPEDVVKKYPEAKLTAEEATILKTWAEAKADSLMN
jgi:uncharacterized membrane protein